MRGRATLRWVGALVCALLLCSVSRADERSTEKRFEAARKDEPSLIAFLKAMPKGGDLHVHVGGTIYAEYLLDNAIDKKLFFDPATNGFTPDDGPGRIPAAKLLEGQAGVPLSKFLDAASMRGYHPGVESGHDHFFRTFAVIGSADDGMEQVLNADVIARAKAQNEQYLELMTRVGPEGAYDGLFFGDLPPVDDPAKALEALTPKLEKFVALARPYLDAQDAALARPLGVSPPISGPEGPVTVRYIVAANRLAPDNIFFGQIAAGMALMRADKRVVGVNILAPEDHPLARTHFETQMRLIDFLWNRFGKPNVTLHAGELTLAISPLEPMRSRIRRSVEVGHARRIGHGVSIAWEDDLPGLFAEMKRDGVAVEICLTSNDGILGVRGDQHPFNLYRKAGIPVSLNTDDEGVNRGNLTMEFVRAVRTYGLSYGEVKELVRNSIEYAFLPGDSLFRDHDYKRRRPEFGGIERPEWKPSPEAQRLLDASDKMRVQVRLERAFTAFEN